jgi:predicted deacylase
MHVGSARATTGTRACGTLTVAELPTGGTETVPVVLVNGSHDGPTVWITATVHGDEVTGLATAHDTMAALDPETIRGTVACLPVVNPAGLRQTERTSYYHGDDPNRLFPDSTSETSRQPNVQALIAERLYETIVDSADAVIDLHTAQPDSMPFVIRDRVLYGTRRSATTADALAEEVDRLVTATELPVVTEFPASEYLDQNLHRSLAGSVLNDAGIPACTFELGSARVVEESHRAAGVAAVCRILATLDVLDDVRSRIERAAPTIEAPIDGQVRRHIGPRAPGAGIIRHTVEAGDSLAHGDPIARIVRATGERRFTIESSYEGYVLARRTGVTAYENDPLTSLAIRDETDLVVPRD